MTGRKEVVFFEPFVLRIVCAGRDVASDAEFLDQFAGTGAFVYEIQRRGLYPRLSGIFKTETMIRSLTGLRFVSALMIFMHHFPMGGRVVFFLLY